MKFCYSVIFIVVGYYLSSSLYRTLFENLRHEWPEKNDSLYQWFFVQELNLNTLFFCCCCCYYCIVIGIAFHRMYVTFRFSILLNIYQFRIAFDYSTISTWKRYLYCEYACINLLLQQCAWISRLKSATTKIERERKKAQTYTLFNYGKWNKFYL